MELSITDEIERLKHDYNDLKAEINELNNLINKSQISNSRKRGVYTSAGATCEAILKFIYQKEGNNNKPANKLMLDELLIKVADILSPQVMINFRTIQAWRNLGTHDKDDMRNVDNNSFIMVDIALTNIVNWFFTSYLKIDIILSHTNFNNKPEEITNIQKNKDIIKSSASLPKESKKAPDSGIKSEKKITDSKENSKSNILYKPSQEQNLQENKSQAKFYPEIKMGNQIWMLNNLNAVEFSNGEPIPQAKSKDDWFKAGNNHSPAWCYYKTDAKGDSLNGLLYNWYAVTDPRGLAPFGWRVPSKNDFEELIRFWGGQKRSGYMVGRYENQIFNPNSWYGLERRKETGTYTSGSNFAWWSCSEGNKYGHCFQPEDRLVGFHKGAGFPVLCIK